ncbi:hypothetical protein M9H77_26098 [Catharanthus roseus]|uniref:Uncharacterized protein n=1 Tax=Catharanthus roseus TaxID=4058 RepID=A0ACC0AAJ6_CATRO|nr:hypothetical protein M9H77_26098 [Catharanthus roseus]
MKGYCTWSKSLRRFGIRGGENSREKICMGPGLTHVKGLRYFDGDSGNTPQAILVEKFSKSKELEELHKHHSGQKERKYVILPQKSSGIICLIFYIVGEISRGKEEATTMGIPVPDDLDLMAIVARGVRCGRVYGAGSEAVPLRAESSQPSCRGLASIGLCCADILRRMEAALPSVFDAFDEHTRRFVKQNHLVYIPLPPMLDLVRAGMGIGASASSAPTPVVDLKTPTSDVARFDLPLLPLPLFVL